MTDNHQFISRLSQLTDLEKSTDYSKIINELNIDFDSDVNHILEKWTSNQKLTDNDKTYLKSYSNIHLSIVKYCLFYSNIQSDIEILIDKLIERLFQRTQIETLATIIDFIRNQQSNNRRRINENDRIFIDLMKLIDARSLTYRLINDFHGVNTLLDDALNDCLFHSFTKSYLRNVKSNYETNSNMEITYQHQFFLGCSTFGVALCRGNKEKLKNKPDYDKFICLLVKYIRIMLNRTDFINNSSIHYCLRGIFSLLTNSIPHTYWLDIMNKGLNQNADQNDQMKNPFNLDLFSLIINKLLASETLQKKTDQSILNDETLLIDSTMVFIVKWADTQKYFDDNDIEESANERSSSINQLLYNLQINKSFKNTTRILISYIDAKYDRLRLMTLSILSILMNCEDFKRLESIKPHLGKDLVELIFTFLDRASKHQDQIYKGIPFDTLLIYLYRFLIQDFIKRDTISYLTKIVHYAEDRHGYTLKILRRITTDPDRRDDLAKNQELKQFLDNNANILYASSKLYSIIIDIRQRLVPPPARSISPEESSESNECQVFISYCRKEKEQRDKVLEKLNQTKLFSKIWIDDNDMIDSAYETTPKAIKQSKVLIVLLSDNYCNSDFCRLEWTYAIKQKIQIYVITVQENFNKEKYDWVSFIIGDQIYYKLHRDSEMQKLIKGLTQYINKKFPKQGEKPLSVSSPLPKKESMIPTNNQEYLQRSSIIQWTNEDIQNWCSDNHLERWRKPLKYFNGETLLKLRRDLSNDCRVSLVTQHYDLDLFEIIRFKNEVDRIIFPSTIKCKSSARKILRKRRSSKTPNE